MGLRVYWELCRRHGIKCSSEKWYEESPESVRVSECGEYEIWWDRSIATPKRLDQHKPDVVVIDKKAKHWTLIDLSVPLDQNVLKKEEEKVLHLTRFILVDISDENIFSQYFDYIMQEYPIQKPSNWEEAQQFYEVLTNIAENGV